MKRSIRAVTNVKVSDLLKAFHDVDVEKELKNARPVDLVNE